MTGKWSTYADCARGSSIESSNRPTSTSWPKSLQSYDEHESLKLALQMSTQVS